MCTKVKSQAAVRLCLIKTIVKMSNVSLFNAPLGSFGQISNAIMCMARCMYACMEFCNQSGLISMCKQVREGLHDTGKDSRYRTSIFVNPPVLAKLHKQSICSSVQSTLSIPCCGRVYILDGEIVANDDKTSVPLSCCFWRPAFV